jgi:membrane-bound ClpP family serine protease
MENLIKRLVALLEVKSMVTLVLVFVGCWGFMTNLISGEVFAGWVGMILVYFFNKERKE